MKRLFGFALGALVVFMNVLPLKAQSVYGVEMVKENDSVKQLFPDGTNILNTIDTSKSEFEKGKVAIEITINNSKKTEVVYVVDNGSANTIKTELIDAIKTKASNLASYNNLYQSVITNTNEGIVYKPFDTNISNSLEEVKALASGENGSFDTLLSEANSKFSTDTVNKVIVLFVSMSFSAFFVSAKEKDTPDHESTYIYYKSIKIEKGDTLWDIANENLPEKYSSTEEYVKVLKEINGLSSDKIYSGENLMIMYMTE